MKSIWTAILLTLGVSGPAQGSVFVEPPVRDEVSGTVAYGIDVRAETYQDYVDEDSFHFSCGPQGQLSAQFHWGGQQSGDYAIDGQSISYRIDADPAVTVDAAKLRDPVVVASIYHRLLSARHLAIKMNDWGATVGMDVRAFRRVASARSPFARHCASALGY